MVLSRLASSLVALATATVPWLASAQAWLVQSGATARGEYSDNYFFTDGGEQSGFTASISPFVAAVRRTEASEVTAFLSVGANRVWGPSPSIEYLSGRAGVDAVLSDGLSTWRGNISFARSPSLQNELVPDGVILTLAQLDSFNLNGSYDYQVSENWSLGAQVSAFDNRYDSVEGEAPLQDNRGYSATGTAEYAFSDRTQLMVDAVFSHYASDISKSDVVVTTFGVVHRFSPQLTMSASVGGFWSETEAKGNASDIPIATDDRGRDHGPIFGGGISYVYSERTRFSATVAEGLSPSSTGTLSRTDTTSASVSHDFSDRLTGKLGASYTRTKFPSVLEGSFRDEFVTGEVGFSYRIAERWSLDGGYRYLRAKQSQPAGEPRSNLVFLTIGYNWPGATLTDWIGARQQSPALPGAGPLMLRETAPGPDVPAGSPGPPGGSSWDRLPTP